MGGHLEAPRSRPPSWHSSWARRGTGPPAQCCASWGMGAFPAPSSVPSEGAQRPHRFPPRSLNCPIFSQQAPRTQLSISQASHNLHSSDTRLSFNVLTRQQSGLGMSRGLPQAPPGAGICPSCLLSRLRRPRGAPGTGSVGFADLGGLRAQASTSRQYRRLCRLGRQAGRQAGRHRSRQCCRLCRLCRLESTKVSFSTA